VITVVAALLVATSVWLAMPAWPAERARVIAATHDSGSASVDRGERFRRLWTKARDRIGLGSASRRRRAHERMRVIQALGALAAELQAGQPPVAALTSAGGQPSVWPATVAAVRLGEDVSVALVVDAAHHPALHHLAACWQVAADSGSGLAPAVTQLAASARSAEDVRVHLEAELAGPRATARMLAVLPFVGLGFGIMLGADPVTWLLTSPFGMGCLAAGLSLTGLGTWWTGRIAAGVERML
jgi:tight adherence protein B